MEIKQVQASPQGVSHTRFVLLIDKSYKELESLIADMKNGHYEVEFKPKKEKRSLSQNAYYNELLDKYQQKLMSTTPVSRAELHERMLSDYGVTRRWEDGRPMLIPLGPEQDAHDLGLHAQVLNAGTLNGKECVWWRVVKGSSEMNTTEFSHLLDGLIQECIEQGIDTTPSAKLNEKRYTK